MSSCSSVRSWWYLGQETSAWCSSSCMMLQNGRCESHLVSSDTQNSHLLCHDLAALLLISSFSVMYLPVSQFSL